MEIAGAAASVAGIIGFTGQALTGLVALKNFVESIKDGPKTAATVISDIEALESSLQSVSDLILQYEREAPANANLEMCITFLRSHVETCCREVHSWKEEYALNSGPRSIKSILKRIASAGHKESLEKLAMRVSRQQQILNLDLSSVGR
jgi:hypothetical protein